MKKERKTHNIEDILDPYFKKTLFDGILGKDGKIDTTMLSDTQKSLYDVLGGSDAFQNYVALGEYLGIREEKVSAESKVIEFLTKTYGGLSDYITNHSKLDDSVQKQYSSILSNMFAYTQKKK